MSTLSYGCCFKDGRPCKHGPPHTIVYVSSRTAQQSSYDAKQCTTFARIRAWKVTDTVVESTSDLPLDQREGWQRVMAAVGDGTADVVLVCTPQAVGMDVSSFELMKTDFINRETVLTAVSGIPDPYPDAPRKKH